MTQTVSILIPDDVRARDALDSVVEAVGWMAHYTAIEGLDVLNEGWYVDSSEGRSL